MTFTSLLRDEVSVQKQAIFRLVKATPLWIAFIPFIGAGIIYLLNTTWLAPWMVKSIAEIIAPSILAVALAIAVFNVTTCRHTYYKWLALVALALFCRELHFQGTNAGFYIAIAILLIWAARNWERLEPYYSDRTLEGLFWAAILSYLLSKMFDRHMFDNVLPVGTTRDLFEENLEILGHLLFLALTIVTVPKRRLHNSQT